ncbi:MAG: IPTL-CTERM sorting domain-containing protein [Sphingobacteriia bacterium]|nr:IPTL-CTERM sorting domain-containing protein [Sphingobacteriia bacterium]NCC40166.1 IPTL-CTERM sorting domain-containing protein [Gammaproteobacteria bacterium]
MTLRNPRALPSKTVLSIAIAGLLLGSGVQAATIMVTSDADDGGTDCTLRKAIESINAGSNQEGCVAVGTYGTNDTILFASSVTGEIELTGTQIAITKSVRIQGRVAADLAVDGASSSRVFDISGTGVAVSIDRLTIRNGLASGGFPDGAGGGIRVRDNASLELSNSTVSGNSAVDGGGIFAASGAFLTLTNSAVSGNSTDGGGGGIDAFFNASVTLTNSRVSGNSATGGGGIIADNNASVTLTNSMVSGNSVSLFGGGILAFNNASVTLTNSTVSGNSAGRFGGGLDARNSSSVTLTNSTVSGNSANFGGGGIDAYNNSPVTLTNTLLAGNNTDCSNNDSTVTGNFNLIGDAASACGLTNGANNNIVGIAPLIGPLADNGCLTPAGNSNGPPELYGCVQTHALQSGSPAIDAATAIGAPSTDQRGVSRPQRDGFDIGAFELEREPDAIPTLPLWGLLAGSGLLGLLGAWRQRRTRCSSLLRRDTRIR